MIKIIFAADERSNLPPIFPFLSAQVAIQGAKSRQQRMAGTVRLEKMPPKIPRSVEEWYQAADVEICNHRGVGLRDRPLNQFVCSFT